MFKSDHEKKSLAEKVTDMTEKLKEKKIAVKELEEKIQKLREENLEYRFISTRNEQSSKDIKENEGALMLQIEQLKIKLQATESELADVRKKLEYSKEKLAATTAEFSASKELNQSILKTVDSMNQEKEKLE